MALDEIKLGTAADMFIKTYRHCWLIVNCLNRLVRTNYCVMLPLLSDGFAASLPAGASDLPSSLSSPVINVHGYKWKCLRFWYFIGATDARDWHTTSLMLLLRTVTSNRTMVLFFADEVTDKARYTQIPLSRNCTNSEA